MAALMFKVLAPRRATWVTSDNWTTNSFFSDLPSIFCGTSFLGFSSARLALVPLHARIVFCFRFFVAFSLLSTPLSLDPRFYINAPIIFSAFPPLMRTYKGIQGIYLCPLKPEGFSQTSSS